MNCSPNPAAAMISRAARSTSSHGVPTTADATLAAWASCSTA